MLKIKLAAAALFVCALIALGCSEKASIIHNIEAELSPHITTVIYVRWTTDVPTTGLVEFGTTSDLAFATPLEETAATEHEAMLLGMPTDTEVHFRVAVWDGDEADASDIQKITTGFRPTGLPTVDVAEGTEGNHDHFTITSIMGSQNAITIFNSQGQYVWYHFDDRDLEFFRARLSKDGKSVLYNAGSVSGDPSEESDIVRVSLDGSEVTSIPIPLLAHDFIEMDDGTIAAIVTEYRDFDGQELRGNAIVEVAPDGTQTTVWSAWDCFDPAIHENDDMWTQGWTFFNALDYYELEDFYLVGSWSFSSIIKVDRQTGECPVVFGAGTSDIATTSFVGSSYPFLHQHQYELLERDGEEYLLVFDNFGHPSSVSRVVEYHYDADAATLEQIWSYSAGISTIILGEVVRLDDGDTLVTWSFNGQMDRVSSEEESEWRANMDMGTVFGFSTTTPTLYVNGS